MPRWLALDAAGEPLGLAFEAPDKATAHRRGRTLYPGHCATVQSELSWTEGEASDKTAQRERRDPNEPWRPR